MCLFVLFSLQFVKTILSQGHLTPLPLYVSPVYWAYDYSLRVYPIPDVIVFADKYDPFSITSTDCLCVNPVRNNKNISEGS